MIIVICTPRAALKVKIKHLEKELGQPIKIVPTPEIYMNMQDGWSEQKCDDTFYLVEEEVYLESQLKKKSLNSLLI